MNKDDELEEIIWLLSELTTQIDEDNTVFADKYLKITKDLTKRVMKLYVKADN